MNKHLYILFLLLCSYATQAQLGNNGALISVKDGAMMSVHEEVVNYNGGEFHNADTIYAFYDWTNNAGNEAFISLGEGIVYMYGDDQRIKGTDITRFFDLRLDQTGVKYGDLDVYVDGYLRLKDRQFHLDTNCVSVFNSEVFAVDNNGHGYVSALNEGGLMRHTESLQSYFYPVGWPNYYRPLELRMSSINLNQMKVRMAFADATTEGFDRDLREETLCEVIPTFYHRVYQLGGTDSARVKIHYDPAVDGIWNTIAHFQNLPLWEDTGIQTMGIDPYTGLDFNNTVAFNTNFAEPAFALATSSGIIPLVADDTVICDGQTVTFTGEPGYDFYHFQLNGVTVQSSTSNTYTDSGFVTNDTITYYAVAAECVYYGSEIVITSLPLPILTASSNVPACELGSLELFADGGDMYAWSGPNGFTSIDQNPVITNLTLAAAGTYTVTVTNVLGCTASTTTDVTVLAAPIPTASSNAPICIGNNIELMSTGGITYEWSGPNGFTSIQQNPTINNPPFSYAGTYTVTITDGNGCTNSTTTDVIINDVPTATASNDSPVCLGQDVTLNATGGTTYNWTGPNGFTSNDQNPVLTGTTLLENGTYTVTVTDGNSCTATASTSVLIYDLPVVSASNNSPTCVGEGLTLSSSGGQSYAWSGPNGFTSTNQNPLLDPVSLLSVGTYTVTATDNNGCTNTASTNVIINPLPTVTIGSNSPVCLNETINLTSDGGVSYAWSGPNGFTSLDQNPNIASATLLENGTYTVTVTDVNGCVGTNSTIVIVNDLPATTATNNGAVCLGDDITLGATGGNAYVWSGPNGFTSNDQNPTISNTILLANGTYTVTVTDGNTCSATAETIVVINDLPIVTATNNSPICDGGTLNLGATGGDTYSWVGPNGFTSNDQNPILNPVSLLSAGTYSVTVTDNNGCTNTSSTDVIINPLPTVAIGSNSPVCLNETINLTSDGGVTYAWSGPNGFTSLDQNSSIATATLLENGTYTVTVTDANGCINTNTVDIIVNDLPVTTAANDGPVCLGEDITLGATGGTSYTWSGPNSFTSTDQNPILTNVTLDMAGTYTVTITDGNACNNTAETVVFINALPQSSATSNSPICDGDDINLFGFGGDTYAWTGPNGFISNNQNPIITPSSIANTGTYTVTVTDANGCTNIENVNVIINELPTATSNNNSPVCLNEIINLNADGGATYIWEGPNAFSSNLQNPTLAASSLLTVGTYTVTVTDANGCSSTSTTDVSINDLPMPTASNNGPTCLDDDIQLSSTGGNSYAWTGPNGFISNDQNPLLSNVGGNENGTYVVTVTDGNGCTNIASTLVIIYSPVTITAINSSPVCIGENVNLNVDGEPTWTYSWSNDNGFTSNDQFTTFLGDDILDSGTYTVTITDGNGCTATSSTIVVVSDFPEIETTTSGIACEFASIQLETTYDPNWDYEWEGANGFIDSIFNPILENVGFEDEGFYYVTVTNATGCQTLDTIYAEVHDDLMATSFGDTTIVEGGSAFIGVTDGIDFVWFPSSSLNCPDCQEAIATPNSTTDYDVIVVDENGCLDTFSILVQVEVRTEEGLIVPNAITPNKDGKNDVWFIPWLDQFPNNEVVILNRWGDEVFKDKPYQNDFNGKYEGRDLPAGTYYYILLLGEDFAPFKGPLTIIRE